MRIAVATDVTVRGGVDTYVIAYLGALLRREHEPTLLVERDTVSQVGEMAQRLGVPVVPVPLYRKWHPRHVVNSACRAALTRIGPDGVHVVTGSPRSCLALRSLALDLGIRLVITEQQVSQDVALSEAERAAIGRSYAGAEAVVFVTTGNRTTMHDAVGSAGARSVVIPNGVDLDELAPFRRPGFRPRVPARLVAVARLSPEKSLGTLVAAVALLPGRLVKDLTIYGDGPDRARLESMIEHEGLGDRVVLAGWIDDVAPKLREHDVFVLSSLAEGMPHALLEAMAVGLPAVCSDVPGNVEALAGGRAGWIVPSGDVHALADVIRRSVEEPDETEARARRAFYEVHRRYDRAAIMKRTIALWDCTG